MHSSWKAAAGLACAALLGAYAASARPAAKKQQTLKYDDAKMNPASPAFDRDLLEKWQRQQPLNRRCRDTNTGKYMPMDYCERAMVKKPPKKPAKKLRPPKYDDRKMNPASPDYDEKALSTWRNMQPHNRKCRDTKTGEYMPMDYCERAMVKQKKKSGN